MLPLIDNVNEPIRKAAFSQYPRYGHEKGDVSELKVFAFRLGNENKPTKLASAYLDLFEWILTEKNGTGTGC